MTYRGYVRNGQITLDPGERLPEGAYVSVEVLQAQRPNGTARDRHELLRTIRNGFIAPYSSAPASMI